MSTPASGGAASRLSGPPRLLRQHLAPPLPRSPTPSTRKQDPQVGLLSHDGYTARLRNARSGSASSAFAPRAATCCVVWHFARSGCDSQASARAGEDVDQLSESRAACQREPVRLRWLETDSDTSRKRIDDRFHHVRASAVCSAPIGQATGDGDRQGRRLSPAYWQRQQQHLAQTAGRGSVRLDRLRVQRAALL